MLLKTPFLISSRLLPAIRIAGCTISLEHIGYGRESRAEYLVYFDFADGRELTEAGLAGPAIGEATLQEMFSTLLAFLGACAEGRKYERTDGEESENSKLFAETIAEWAETNSDEISCLQFEIEETEGLIEE